MTIVLQSQFMANASIHGIKDRRASFVHSPVVIATQLRTHTPCDALSQKDMLHPDQHIKETGPFFVHLCGNISVGKTTNLDAVAAILRARNVRVVVVKEDVESWRHVGGQNGVNLFQLMYEDMKRPASERKQYCTIFQFKAMLRYYNHIREQVAEYTRREHVPPEIVLIERHQSENQVFVDDQHRLGIISDDDYVILRDLAHEIELTGNVSPSHLCFHLTPRSVDDLVERQRMRGTSEESGMTREYLQSLQDAYSEWEATSKREFSYPIQVTSVPSDVHTNPSMANALAQDIVSRLLFFYAQHGPQCM